MHEDDRRSFTFDGYDGVPHHFTYWDEVGGTSSAGPARPSNARWIYTVDDDPTVRDAGEVTLSEMFPDAAGYADIERRIVDHYIGERAAEVAKIKVRAIR